MPKPLTLANICLVVASTLFAMSLSAGIGLFVFYSFAAVLLAGQLVGQARNA